MSFSFEVKQLKVRPLPQDILVIDMDMGEMKTESGIIVQSDDGKSHGVKPRWAKVYKVGNAVKEDVKVGQWVLIDHGRWTRKIKIDDGEGVKEVQKIEVKSILAISNDKPADFYIGKEYGHGDTATIRPEDFGAR